METWRVAKQLAWAMHFLVSSIFFCQLTVLRLRSSVKGCLTWEQRNKSIDAELFKIICVTHLAEDYFRCVYEINF